ncbi:MAG TPA: FAD-binding protein, partial [Thermoplasmata archaeon]|nr:FAD-binding protein [Thermoplasmata archaeon]
GRHPDAELAPRDVVARAIQQEIQRSAHRRVYLDATGLPRDRLFARFPSVSNFLLAHGVDPSRQMIPVAPVAHYMIGGVTTDLEGRSSIPGLFAVGEAAATGVHGANRLGSNSLVEGLVFGERAARRLRRPAAGGPREPPQTLSVARPRGEGAPEERDVVQEIRTSLWEEVGIVRSAETLADALARFEAIGRRVEPRGPDGLAGPVANAAMTSFLVARAALARTESRGVHYRSDFPRPRKAWQHHLGLRLASRPPRRR